MTILLNYEYLILSFILRIIRILVQYLDIKCARSFIGFSKPCKMVLEIIIAS